MKRVLLANDRTMRLVHLPGESGVFSFLEYHSADDARHYLERFAHDTGAVIQLRRALAEDSYGLDVPRMTDDEVFEEMAHRVVMRQFGIAEQIPDPPVIIEKPEPASSSSEPPPLPRPTKKLTWIEFQVIWDSTGKPVKNVRLVVRTPDGVENYHDTNSEGKVRIDEIEPGSCDLRGDLKAAKLADTLDFVALGSGSASSDGNGAAQSTSGALRIAHIEAHKVKKSDSIKSLATAAGMTWQELSKFNWGTDVPNEINKHLRDDVGCTKKTKDGYNYMFDDSDDPGIMFIPRKWTQLGLATGSTHVIRVLDLEEDPNPDEELRVRKEGGGVEVVRSASDTGNVERDEKRRLLLFNFGLVSPGIYRVEMKNRDQWFTVVRRLEVRLEGCKVNGNSISENLNDFELGHPIEDEPDEPTPDELGDFIDQDTSKNV